MFISLDSAKIFSVAFGSKHQPTILALSGWIGSWEDWLPPMSILSERWRVLSYDHRGSGATIAPVESITFDRLVDDIFAVLEAYHVERCILAASSAATLVALGAILKQPQWFTGLVIVNGVAYRDAPEEKDPFLAGLRANYAATLERFVQLCVPEPECEHIKRWGRQILGRASQDAAIALWRATGAVDLRDSLHSIKQSTLILHGSADPLVSLGSAQWLAAALPNARLRILDGAGHVPILTRPQEVAQEILDFFDGE